MQPFVIYNISEKIPGFDQKPLRYAIDKISPFLKSFCEFPERLIEHAAHQQAEGAAAKFVSYLKFDERSAGPCVAERPAILEMAERAVDIFDENARRSRVAGDAAREGFPDRLIADGHLGDLDRHAGVFGPPANPEVEAQGHELRISLDVADESEHFRRAMANFSGRSEGRHFFVERAPDGQPTADAVARPP